MKHLKRALFSVAVSLVTLSGGAQAAIYPASLCRVMNGLATVTTDGALENAGAPASEVICPAPHLFGVNIPAGSTATFVDNSAVDNSGMQLRSVTTGAAGAYLVGVAPVAATAGANLNWQVTTSGAFALPAAAHLLIWIKMAPFGGGVPSKFLNYSTP